MQLTKQKLKEIFSNQEKLSEINSSLDFASKITYDSADNLFTFNFSLLVIETLLKVMADSSTIVAAAFYPLLINNKISIDEIKEKAGDDVAEILTSLLGIEKLKINTKESQAQNIRDMFIALAKDIRVIVLKLAIEQQKVLNLDKLTKEMQELTMQQVKDIFAPISAMISIGHIKSTLENELFKYYKPIEYANLNKVLHMYFNERDEQIKISLEKIKKEVNPIKATIYGRQKQISSIYKKIESGKELSQVYDILAVRVIVDSIDDCYAALGKIHALYKPLERFKDYIAQPKKNGYQSLHTTVVVENGDPLEIQIRTHEMHSYAEYGFAAHWAYKEKRKVNESDNKISYIRSIMEMHKEKSAEEMLEALKIDVFSGNIFCQSPMGKILQFPEGATPIDFAYAIHSNVGNTCVGAKINDKMVPLTTKLKNGDVVEIITNPNSKGPSRDWLKIVKTSEARSKINTFFKKEMKDENIKKGKSILESLAKTKSLTLSKLMKDEFLEEVFDKYSFNNISDMYASVGYGSISGNQILGRLVNLKNEQDKLNNYNLEDTVSKKVVAINHKSDSVKVLGYSNLMTKFAKCCNPLPGDDIIGYVSRGKGVTIHRYNCGALKGFESERFIECEWNTSTSSKFVGVINIIAVNAVSTLAKISKKVADLKLNVTSISTSNKSTKSMTITMGIEVAKKEDLNNLITKLNTLSCVIDIHRAG